MYKSKKFLAVLVITLVLVFAMSFAFVGCKKQTIITPTTQTETTVETTTEPSAAPETTVAPETTTETTAAPTSSS